MITKKCCKCGTDIHKDAKKCPNCFAKQKMPIPKWIFIVIAVLLIGVIANISSKDDSSSEQSNVASNEVSDKAVSDKAVSDDLETKSEPTTEPTAEPTATPIPYEKITIKELARELDDNALNAKDKYLDAYLEVTGIIDCIDASGSYISLDESEDTFNIISPMQCYIRNDAQTKKISKVKKGDRITLRVQVTDVGEVMKYQADIIEIK